MCTDNSLFSLGISYGSLLWNRFLVVGMDKQILFGIVQYEHLCFIGWDPVWDWLKAESNFHRLLMLASGSLVLGTIQLLQYLSLAVYLGSFYLWYVWMNKLDLILTFFSMGIFCFTDWNIVWDRKEATSGNFILMNIVTNW
ncbi:hypothetical protein XENTR_v10024431 [Xenopus tropicalis]|nr:hypothetical protein XENTR_v10024431 [Xenopus tropicalis]KAE8580446.1 hypothetical protein XENTR_v10024431 [Xenopus tropicalis]